MVAYTFVHIALIKINERFGNATTGARETGKHFKRTKRLIRFEMMIMVI